MILFFHLKKNGKSIVLVSHDLNVIQANCDRAMFLNEGKIVDIGDPKHVIESYTNYFKEQSS